MASANPGTANVNAPGTPAALPRRQDRVIIMGVLNVTPDSFSDGGMWTDLDRAVAYGMDMRASGADIIDIGGESTRPGAQRVSEQEELRRILPVIRCLAVEDVTISVDTTRSRVAAAAIEAGAALINDVSGGRHDHNMALVVRDAGCPWVLAHSRGQSANMQRHAHYCDVVAEVRDELSARVDAAVAAGVPSDAIVLDPGLGFAKQDKHNWALLRHLDTFRRTGLPVLIGASRKRFLGALLAAGSTPPRPARLRDGATAAVTTYAALRGVWGVRVHDVGPNVDAALVAAAIRGVRDHPPATP